MSDSPDISRALAAAALHKGADRIYLFNFCYLEYDQRYEVQQKQTLTEMLNDMGSLETIVGKTRRHIVTHTDFVPLGMPMSSVLPASCGPEPIDPALPVPGNRAYFRIYVGPRPTTEKTLIFIGLPEMDAVAAEPRFEVRVNSQTVAGSRPEVAPLEPIHPVAGKMLCFSVPSTCVHDGYNLVEVSADRPAQIVWAEVVLQA